MNKLNLKNKSVLTRFSLGLFLGFGLIAGTTSAMAANESESNDIFSDADNADLGSNSGVIGDLSGASNDVDIWKFNLTENVFMTASITNGPAADYSDFNPLIVLFKEDSGKYYPVQSNGGFGENSFFGFNPWESGTYFLTVSAFQNSPQDRFNNNQSNPAYHSYFDFGTEILGTSFDHFQNQSFSSFDYNVSFTGITSAVPIPAAIWLMVSGMGILGFVRKRNISNK